MDWIDELARGWERDFSDLELSSLPPLIRLVRLTSVVERFQRDVLEPFELTAADYSVLALLQSAGRPYALKPSQLYGQLRRSSGGMTKILKRLEGAGFVARQADPEDARSVRVALTSRGLAVHERVFRAFVAASNRVLNGLSDSQKGEIDHSLKRMLGQLEGQKSD